MARISGVCGALFKSNGDSAALAAWYRTHSSMQLEDFGGAMPKWSDDLAAGEIAACGGRGSHPGTRLVRERQACVDHGPRREQDRALGAEGLGRR